MSRTIKEAQQLTGITSQNIRYYEKQGLLTPERNEENSYRLYSEEDIGRLKMIRLFRKLGMPVGEIRRMFEGDISLEEAIASQISRLQSQKEELTAALEFCGKIKEEQLADVDPDMYLEEIEKERDLYLCSSLTIMRRWCGPRQSGIFPSCLRIGAMIRRFFLRNFSNMPEKIRKRS